MKENNEKFKKNFEDAYLNKAERKELKQAGVNIKDKNAVKAYFAEKEAKAAAAAEEEKRIADEKAAAERLANPTTEDLLKDIKALLEKQVANK